MTQKDYMAYAKDILKIEFNDIEILVHAFTHRSYLNEHRKSAKRARGPVTDGDGGH